MQVDLKFKIKAGDGQIGFPIYRVPVSGGSEPVNAGDIQNLQVDLDRQVLQSSQVGVMVTAAYSNVAEGTHRIVITGALNDVAFALVYAMRAEELGVPAEVVAPNAYVSLAPTGEGTIEQQIKDLQDRMGTAEGEIVAITAALPDMATKEEVQETLGEILAAIQALPDGQAVSAQVALNTAAIEGLQEDVSELGQEVISKTGGQFAPPMNLEQGAIDSSTGQDSSSTTRIRTNGFIVADEISISTSGNKVYVMGYRADGSFVGKNGWITASQDVIIPNAVKYRVVFAYSNDATITPDDFSSLGIDIKANYIGALATKEMLELGKVYQFVGNGDTMVRKEIKLCPNSYYSVWVDRLYSYGSGVNILGVYYEDAGGNVTLFSTQNINQPRYDFFTPDGVTEYYLYIRATSGEEVNLYISERTDFTENIAAFPTNFRYSTSESTTFSWDSLILYVNGTIYNTNNYSIVIGSGSLVFDKITKSVIQLPSISQLRDNHILLLTVRNNQVVAGVLASYVHNGANNIIAIPSNITFDGAIVKWDSLNIRTKDNSYTLAAGEYNLLSAGSYLALNTITGAINQLASTADFHKEHILLLYYNNAIGAFAAGCLYAYYSKSQFDGVQNTLETAFKYAYENVLSKSAKRMADIEWTPKAEVITNEGVREPGVTYKGIPYSSVKELQKFVGLDTSIHTFMTAVNDVHSLFYTERIAEYDPNNPQNTRSAYGITYHGENGISYYGNVCSAYVSICLGYPIQYDSWDWLGYYFDLFYSLEPQSEDNIQVGDVLWEPGHCSVVTKIKRGINGELINATISEQAAPIAQTTYGKANLYNRRRLSGGVWCRVKNLSHDVFYTPIPFLLIDNENLYDSYKSFVYIDSDTGRKFYMCLVPNRRSTFLASDWGEISEWVNGQTYSIVSIASYNEKLYKSLLYENTQPLTDKDAWEEIRGIHEWEPYPYVYNNDIVSFAGDRAVYHENDLIYINYTKGNYAQMELYKDGALIQTLVLSSDSSAYQINVSSYCSDAGMYRARLINGNDKSRFTYFEVVDAELSVSEDNGNYLLTFDSQTGIALEAKIVTLSGYPIARLALTDLDRKRGYVIINADALGAAQSRGVVGKDYEDTELYAVVTFAGQWGNVLTNKVSIGVHSRMDGINVYPNKNVDLGKLSDGSNILLAGRLLETFNFTFMADTGASINILSTTDDLKWETSFPAFETGKTYMVEVRNGFAKIVLL